MDSPLMVSLPTPPSVIPAPAGIQPRGMPHRMRSQRTRWGVGTGYVIPSEAEKSLGLDCSPAHAGVLMPAHGEPVEPPAEARALARALARNLAALGRWDGVPGPFPLDGGRLGWG